MAMEFTPDQTRVIQLHNRNILVSAAAGSGKTAVLVERIIRMITDEDNPVDIDRLLIVTFTNAAAAEMRERISLGISQRLYDRPESVHIQRQSTLLHNAQITTIDSFCMFLIRNHFNEIGLDPAFRVADEGEMKLLEQDVLKDMLEEKFREGRELFHHCVEYFCPAGRETVLEQYILQLYRCAASHPWPEDWLLERRQDYASAGEDGADALHLEETDYGCYLLRHLQMITEGCCQTLLQAQRLCQEPDGPYMYGELVDQELEILGALSKLKTIEEFAARLPAVAFGRLPSKKDDSVSVLKRELVKKLRSQIKETVQGIEERFFATPLGLSVCQARSCQGPVEELTGLVLEFGRQMRRAKQEKNLLDFMDMEHFALEILLRRVEGRILPSPVALEYRQYFHEILIDEYQDSNLVQEYLLKAVSGEEEGNFNRFMVGDVKQSIYKFRLARPELFLEKYETYTAMEGNCQRIDLHKNFRSRGEVIDTVNGVFSRIMSKITGGIQYDDSAALYAGAEFPQKEDCQSELWLVEKPSSQEEYSARQAEAMVIADRIKGLRGEFQVTDKADGKLRPVKFSDMVILLRTTSGWDEEFKKVLEGEGIPVYITSKTGYFAAVEVQELLQLLRVLDNPLQDIPLFGVMKSVFGGFGEEEIAQIRSLDRKISLFDAVCMCAEGEAGPDGEEDDSRTDKEGGGKEQVLNMEGTEEQDRQTQGPEEQDMQMQTSAGYGRQIQASDESRKWLRNKSAAFLEKLSAYRECTVYMPIRELLEKLVRDHDYLNYVSALPSGSRRRANVEMLFTKASEFEKTSYFGLFHFIRYIEQLEKYDVDYGEALLLDENADVVRIMSIHKSKGLEFPVTFISGVSKRFNMQDANQSFIVDMDMGIGTDYVNPEKRIRNKTLRRNVLARKMREDNLAEELRVLYVAMTRPKEKMILTACVEKAQEKWEMQKALMTDMVSYQDFMEAGSFLDFLLPVADRSGIHVEIAGTEGIRGAGAREQVKMYERKEMLGNAQALSDQEALSLLKSRFSYEYPYRAWEKLYTKTTVSELKIAAMAQKDEAAYHTFEAREVVPYIPKFCREKEEVSGTVRGNAFHKVMELMDFNQVYAGFPQADTSVLYGEGELRNETERFCREISEDMVSRQLKQFLEEEVAQGRLSEEFFQAVSTKKLLNFLKSPIAFRMWAAQQRGELYREQPFVYGVSAGRLGAEFPREETVLIQGIIDVFFMENGQLVLLDYKTDVIKSPKELWNRYQVQLDYYEEALCRLTECKMKEKILYSFYLEKCVHF